MDDEFKKQLLGVTTEVGSGIATDVATTPLLAGGPLGIAAYVVANFGQGAYTNYLVQKHLYGNENINWGEVLGSGAAGAIPFMNIGASAKAAKYVGKAGSIKRGIVGGLGTALVGEQTRVGIDEKRFLSPTEATLTAGVGGTFGGAFTAMGKKFKRPKNTSIQKDELMKVYAMGNSNPSGPNNIARGQILKRLGYLPEAQPASKYFSAEDIQGIEERAFQHRLTRKTDAKSDFMKDFNESLSYKRSDREFDEVAIVVRKDRVVNKSEPWAKENYHIRTLSQMMQDMRVKSGWLALKGDKVKEMQAIRSLLNKLGTDYGDDPVLARLMEYGDEAYIEHIIGKAQYDWLWNLVAANPENYPWIVARSRNDPENLRLLVNQAYKSLKDSTETRIKKLYNSKLPVSKRFIVNLEDPMSSPFGAPKIIHRSNPGNIQILSAKPTDKQPEIVGILGDYLADFYTRDFKQNYNGKRLLSLFKSLPAEQQKRFGMYAPKTTKKTGKLGTYDAVESATDYRDRIFNERLDFVIKERGKFTYEQMQEAVFNDMLDFYDLFSAELGVIKAPQYIKDVMSRIARKAAGKSNRGVRTKAEYEFNKRLAENMQSLLNEIEAFGKGERRFGKTYANKLIRALNQMSGLRFDFETNINNLDELLEPILKKLDK